MLNSLLRHSQGPDLVDADGYPLPDDEPLSEGMFHMLTINMLVSTLRTFLRGRPDAIVTSNLLTFYRQGDRSASVAPDFSVAFGVADASRDWLSYKTWQEPPPSFVLEVLSPKTCRTDSGEKFRIYAEMGVAEYWLYDPKGLVYATPLSAYVLRDGAYSALPMRRGRCTSESLGVGFGVGDDGALRLYDAATGERIPTHDDLVEQNSALRRQAARTEAQLAQLQARLRDVSDR